MLWLMNDDASRLLHPSHQELLSHYDSVYPQPVPRAGCLSSEMSSLVTIELCRQHSDPAFFSPAQPTISENYCWTSTPHTKSIHGSQSRRPDPIPPSLRTKIPRRTTCPRPKSFRSRTVSDALCLVGQTYKLLGARDYSLDRHTGQIDFCLQRQFRAYEKLDPPPQRDKRVSIHFVRHVHKSIAVSPAAQ
jgi:hypothetical protein